MIRRLGKALWAILTDTFCNHEWETVEEFYVWKDDLWKTEHLTHHKIKPAENFTCKGKIYHQKCVYCQEMRQERVEI